MSSCRHRQGKVLKARVLPRLGLTLAASARWLRACSGFRPWPPCLQALPETPKRLGRYLRSLPYLYRSGTCGWAAALCVWGLRVEITTSPSMSSCGKERCFRLVYCSSWACTCRKRALAQSLLWVQSLGALPMGSPRNAFALPPLPSVSVPWWYLRLGSRFVRVRFEG